MNPFLLPRRWDRGRGEPPLGAARAAPTILLPRLAGGRCLCVDAPFEVDCVWTDPDGTVWQVGIIRGRAYTLCWSE